MLASIPHCKGKEDSRNGINLDSITDYTEDHASYKKKKMKNQGKYQEL